MQNLFNRAQDVREFASAGKATLTIESRETGTRFTYRIKCPEDRGILFVSVLSGADNESAYSYFGYIRRGIFFYGGQKAKCGPDAPSVKAFAWTWKRLMQDRIPANVRIWHEGRCGRCGRKLTVPSSIASGLGPECATREDRVYLAEEVA